MLQGGGEVSLSICAGFPGGAALIQRRGDGFGFRQRAHRFQGLQRGFSQGLAPLRLIQITAQAFNLAGVFSSVAQHGDERFNQRLRFGVQIECRIFIQPIFFFRNAGGDSADLTAQFGQFRPDFLKAGIAILRLSL